jgi:hypothetical protein
MATPWCWLVESGCWLYIPVKAARAITDSPADCAWRVFSPCLHPCEGFRARTASTEWMGFGGRRALLGSSTLVHKPRQGQVHPLVLICFRTCSCVLLEFQLASTDSQGQRAGHTAAPASFAAGCCRYTCASACGACCSCVATQSGSRFVLLEGRCLICCAQGLNDVGSSTRAWLHVDCQHSTGPRPCSSWCVQSAGVC